MRIEVQALIQLFGLSIESSQLQSGLRSMGFEAKEGLQNPRSPRVARLKSAGEDVRHGTDQFWP
jgi:hypothetical protein